MLLSGASRRPDAPACPEPPADPLRSGSHRRRSAKLRGARGATTSTCADACPGKAAPPTALTVDLTTLRLADQGCLNYAFMRPTSIVCGASRGVRDIDGFGSAGGEGVAEKGRWRRRSPRQGRDGGTHGARRPAAPVCQPPCGKAGALRTGTPCHSEAMRNSNSGRSHGTAGGFAKTVPVRTAPTR